MGFVDEKDDGLRRVLYFIDHALKTTLELALDAGTCLQQAEVEAPQFDALQRIGHLAMGDAQCQPFDDGGLADTRFADHDGVVLAPAGEDVDHLADRRIAAEYRVELAIAGLLGEVVGEAPEVGIARCDRLASLLWLLGQSEFAQAFGIELRQQRLVMAAGIAQGIAQQSQNQRRLVHVALAELEARCQQGVLQPLHQLAGKYRVARFAILATRLQRLGQFARIDSCILQGPQQQTIAALQQAEQQVLHQHLAAPSYDAALGCGFQVTAGFDIQRLYQLLQIDVDHLAILVECGPFPT